MVFTACCDIDYADIITAPSTPSNSNMNTPTPVTLNNATTTYTCNLGYENRRPTRVKTIIIGMDLPPAPAVVVCAYDSR